VDLRGIEPLSGNKLAPASTCLDGVASCRSASRNTQSVAEPSLKGSSTDEAGRRYSHKRVILPKSAYMASAEGAAPKLEVNLRGVSVSGAVIGIVCVYCVWAVVTGCPTRHATGARLLPSKPSQAHLKTYPLIASLIERARVAILAIFWVFVKFSLSKISTKALPTITPSTPLAFSLAVFSFTPKPI